MRETTDKTFEEDVLKNELPVLVDFTAGWCGPCKALKPTLESIAKDYEGRLDVFQIDVDKNPQVSQKYGVRSVPLVILFYQGEIFETIVGLRAERHFTDLIEKIFQGSTPTLHGALKSALGRWDAKRATPKGE